MMKNDFLDNILGHSSDYFTTAIETKDDYIEYRLNDGWWHKISIYELVYKCKVWAYNQGYIIQSGFHKNNINQFYINCFGWISSTIDNKNTFENTDEFDGVVKACEWILISIES